MARGKYASTAEARRVRETAITEAAALRRETDRLRQQIQKTSVEHEAERSEWTSRLAALMEGNDPRIAQLSELVEKQAKEIAARKEGFRLAEEVYQAVSDALWTAYIDAGMKEADARDKALSSSKYALYEGSIVNLEDFICTFDTAMSEDKRGKRFSDEERAAVRAIQRARGVRA
jgi:regulator of replication initiation timing